MKKRPRRTFYHALLQPTLFEKIKIPDRRIGSCLPSGLFCEGRCGANGAAFGRGSRGDKEGLLLAAGQHLATVDTRQSRRFFCEKAHPERRKRGNTGGVRLQDRKKEETKQEQRDTERKKKRQNKSNATPREMGIKRES